MALNIKPFEGPKHPEITEATSVKEELVATTSSAEEDCSQNPNSSLLFLKSHKRLESEDGKLKKLDIL